MKFSGFKVVKEALTGHKGWTQLWRSPEPKKAYDIVIVGGGGHGLATAYYLAKVYGELSIAVLEKGWIGSGNAGRNTTIIRSNYLLPGNQPFYEFSMKLWENLEQDTNFNSMVSQRSIINLIHSDGQRDAYRRRGNQKLTILGATGSIGASTLKVVEQNPDLFSVVALAASTNVEKMIGLCRHTALGLNLSRNTKKPQHFC